MKNSVIISFAAIALMAFGATANAQSKIGIIAGFTSSNSNVKDFDTKSVSQYHGGLTLQIPLILGLSLQPSVLYQMKGTSLDQVQSGSSFSVDTKVGYLEIPVAIQYGIDLALLKPYIFTEPFIGYGLNFEAKQNGLNSTIKTIKNDWEEANISRWEYGLGLGAGVNIWRLQISARYFWNFGSLCDDEGKVSTDSITETVTKAFKDGKNFNGVTFSAALFF
jgi:hypothetical protein